MTDERKTKAQLIEELRRLRQRNADLEALNAPPKDALRKSEQALKATLESTADGILAVDQSGRVILANKRFADMWRIPPDLLEEGNDDELLSFVLDQLDDPQGFLSKVRELYQSVRDGFDTLHFRDGRVFERFSRPLALKDKLVGRVWSFRDVTERKRAEEALRESEERYRTTLDSMADAIHVVDSNLRIVLVNDAFRRWCAKLGLRANLVGLTPFEAFPFLPDRVRRQYDEVLKTGQLLVSEETTMLADMKIMTETRKIPVFEKGRVTRIVTVVRDATERKRVEDERRILEGQLRQSQRMEAFGQLAGGIAHDFNNLLQVIAGFGEMALASLAPESRSYPQIEQIMRAAERATALVRQLLAFSRRQAMKLEPADLNGIIAETIGMLRRVIGEHVELIPISGHGLRRVRADRGQIEQVLVNLCVNARDAMPEGGRITIETGYLTCDSAYCAAHPWAKEGEYVFVSVADTGAGIPSEIQERIFEPFFSTKEVGRGTGLGLATVYGIVQQHQGLIHVSSDPGQGAVFCIYLPAVTDEEAGAGAVEQPSAVRGGTETILLAEDEEPVRQWAVAVLEAAGYHVLEARDGAEAIQLFERHSAAIDLALLDLIMPKKTGRHVHDRIRAIAPDMPVLFSSGYCSVALDPSIAPTEGFELIQKPYSRDDLLRRLRGLLDQARRA